MAKLVYLILGGASGTLARYYFAGYLYQKLGTDFPFGTLIVNLSGCFLVGFLSTLIDDRVLLGPGAKVFLMVGFCGAYTTFSTYMLETSHLVMGGEMFKALANIFLSTIVGFIALRLGILIGQII
ncbi:MAG: fluoride efflux transporter CrcB [Candidatus Omnitrophica bacterium]|nr:fluoride efflux transporter CrcB [Candidatus Omnitrophota bacterium]MDE2010033.1 fluoride efflux transporter CrcB [Candidatus Omnitrophota bacterium]MDE2214732.1 fluoride efflux transporter CrcB [Candidatus Omnitrophota bacterium]MDE2231785.1 fluoride efflux transporter CrcB [Candidatus Omnitrophota bacterium]